MTDIRFSYNVRKGIAKVLRKKLSKVANPVILYCVSHYTRPVRIHPKKQKKTPNIVITIGRTDRPDKHIVIHYEPAYKEYIEEIVGDARVEIKERTLNPKAIIVDVGKLIKRIGTPRIKKLATFEILSNHSLIKR